MASDVSPVADRGALDPVAADIDQVARASGVDPERGLSAEEARSRLESHGRNRLAGGKKEPGWRAFLRQYEDFMQVILLAAAVVNQVVTGETGTTVVLAGLTVFNAVIGLRQEAKAEESVKALAQMMKTIARVRRDGGPGRRSGERCRSDITASHPVRMRVRPPPMPPPSGVRSASAQGQHDSGCSPLSRGGVR